MKIILIKSKLKGILIQAAVANPRRLFRTWILEIALLITLSNSSFLPSLSPQRSFWICTTSGLLWKFCSSF